MSIPSKKTLTLAAVGFVLLLAALLVATGVAGHVGAAFVRGVSHFTN